MCRYDALHRYQKSSIQTFFPRMRPLQIVRPDQQVPPSPAERLATVLESVKSWLNTEHDPLMIIVPIANTIQSSKSKGVSPTRIDCVWERKDSTENKKQSPNIFLKHQSSFKKIELFWLCI